MGGMGSGRHWHWGVKGTTDQHRQIDLRRWARDGLLEPGSWFLWTWTQNTETVASIQVEVEQTQVVLHYRARDAGEDWEAFRYPVRLAAQDCHLGGARKWFLCPAQGCGRRVAILYSAKIFACRQCLRLAYPSTRLTAWQRHQLRADKLAERLGWADDPDLMYGMKPKGMHWATFDRLQEEYDEANANAGIALFLQLEKVGCF